MHMEKRKLGATGFDVSRLCLGLLTLGPLQRSLPLAESEKVIAAALERGVNFFDTADLYNSYAYAAQAVRLQRDVVICTKSYDYDAAGAEKSLERALREIGRDYVDIYMLHEQESRHTLRGHWEAVEYLLRMKEAGKIRAFGISTHRIEGVRDALDFPEIEVVFPLINVAGLGIEDGSRDEMAAAILAAHQAGKGVYAMKALGGGNLIGRREECLDYILSLDGIDAVAMGMQSVDEVVYNCLAFECREIPESLNKRLAKQPRKLCIDDWCEGCGACAARCSQGALSIVNNQAVVDPGRCLTCGYCAAACPLFCIKVI